MQVLLTQQGNMACITDVCMLLLLACYTSIRTTYCQYQQIDLSAPSVSCNMSSVYYTALHGTSLNCTGAINGNTTARWSSIESGNPNCVYTKYSQSGPSLYWLLNLGQARNIHRIIIYPDMDSPELMVNIRVLADDVEVFRFPRAESEIISPQYITVEVRATIITLRKGGLFVAACEVQLEDCVKNKHGTNCTQTCSALCADRGGETTCDSLAGNCFACISGRYGTDCQLTCSAGCQNTACNQNTGRCSPCRTGWTGNKCDVCANGYYGETCGNTCSAGCSNTCNKQDGTCNCRTGWSGDKCDACSDGYYKITATGSSDCRKCGNGCETTSCDDVTGSCTCRPGWQSPTCQECVAGRFGSDCQQTCSVGCSDTCDIDTGRCTCRQGWDATTCTACASGYYNNTVSGVDTPGDCIPCGSGCSDTCDGQSGYCTCRTGWEPPFCDQGCVAGRYGQDCGKACPPGCDGPCHVITGNCSCRSQWKEPGCTECSAGHYSPNMGCKACGAGCEDVTSCDPLTGLCSCQRGWEPPTCHVCKTRLWGDNCTMTCGACAGDGSCDRITGACYFGLSSDDGGSNTGAIVGSVVGVGVVICITILVTGLLIRSRRLPRPTLELGETQRSSAAEEENSATECRGDLEVTDELPSGGQGDGPHNYDKLASYENSDDIKPYTSIQTKQPSTHGPQDANTMTASYANVYVTTGNQYENIRNVDI